MKIRTKLSLLLIVLSAVIVFVAGYFSIVTLGNYYRDRMVDELSTQATVFESLISQNGSNDSASYAFIQRLVHASDVRLTLIREDGAVIFESELPQSGLQTLENHRNRPEIVEAITSGSGVSVRHSTTLDIEMLYVAKLATEKLTYGSDSIAIVRVGLPLTMVNMRLAEVRSNIIFISVIILVVIGCISLFVAHRMTLPVRTMNETVNRIRNGNLDLRIPVTTNDELGQLGQTLNDMIDRLNNDIGQLKKLERVRSEFLGNVSHELRTPIFAIQGLLETLLGGALDDKDVRRDFIERALRNTRRLGTLLSDLIEISRIESGDMKMSFRYFDADEFLRVIVAEFLPEAAKKEITLTYTPMRGKTEALGDRERLRQVMNNLIDNAIKYTAEKGSVTVSMEPRPDQVTIAVQDTGPGISPQHLPRIFERFYRVDKERSREAGGTGLGLAIAKHIIEAHGSTIQVESTVGVGTTFHFTLKG